MGEFELIQHYFTSAACARTGGAVELGIGDDCALLAITASDHLAVSTDTLVETVHFPVNAPANLLAQRALAVSVSDLAAMGATPIAFTLALTLPQADPQWLKNFAQGLEQMAAQCQITLIGGDTTRGPLSITVTVLGQVPRQQALLRSGAKEDDCLCVSGSLGDAAAALAWVLNPEKLMTESTGFLLKRYWQPAPELALGRYLLGKATAAQDISDGLLADAAHIAKASSKQLCIDPQLLPLSKALLQSCSKLQAVQLALTGGDDYRLVFTLPADKLAALQLLFPDVTQIGYVTAGEGVKLINADLNSLSLAHVGYQHFERTE